MKLRHLQTLRRGRKPPFWPNVIVPSSRHNGMRSNWKRHDRKPLFNMLYEPKLHV